MPCALLEFVGRMTAFMLLVVEMIDLALRKLIIFVLLLVRVLKKDLDGPRVIQLISVIPPPDVADQ